MQLLLPFHKITLVVRLITKINVALSVSLTKEVFRAKNKTYKVIEPKVSNMMFGYQFVAEISMTEIIMKCWLLNVPVILETMNMITQKIYTKR